MMFDRAAAILLKIEGGLNDDPADDGGETKYGISQRWHPGVDVKNLTWEQAKAIHKTERWDKCRCDELPWALALSTFDAAVQHDAGDAARFLQSSVGAKVDGLIGMNTLNQANTCDLSEAVGKFAAARAFHMLGLEDWPHFGKGWVKRLGVIAYEGGKE